MMSPMEVFSSSFGPVMGGLLGAGVTACGTGAFSAGGGAAAGLCASCASAGVAASRTKARIRLRMGIPRYLGESIAGPKQTKKPRGFRHAASCFPLPGLVDADLFQWVSILMNAD